MGRVVPVRAPGHVRFYGELEVETRCCRPENLLLNLDPAWLNDAIAEAIPVGSSSLARTASPDAKDQDPSISPP
jgi:hypothetical protein